MRATPKMPVSSNDFYKLVMGAIEVGVGVKVLGGSNSWYTGTKVPTPDPTAYRLLPP